MPHKRVNNANRGRTNSWDNLEVAGAGTPAATNTLHTVRDEEPLPLKMLWMFAGVFPSCSRNSTGKEVMLKTVPWALFPLFLLSATLFCFGDGIYKLYNSVLILTNDEIAQEYGIQNAARLNLPNGTWVESAKTVAKKEIMFFVFLSAIEIYCVLMMVFLSTSRVAFFERISDKQTIFLEKYSKANILFSAILGGISVFISAFALAGDTPWYYMCVTTGLSFWLPSFIYTLKMRSSLLTAKYKEYYVQLKQMAGGTDTHEMTRALLDARKDINEVCTLCVEKPLTINFVFGILGFLFLGISLAHPTNQMNTGALMPLYLVFGIAFAYLVFSPLWELTSIANQNYILYQTLCHNRDMTPEKLGCLLQRFDQLCPQALLFEIQVTPGIVRSAFATGLTPLLVKAISWLFS